LDLTIVAIETLAETVEVEFDLREGEVAIKVEFKERGTGFLALKQVSDEQTVQLAGRPTLGTV
jgi:hypothetical protein